MRNLHFVVVQDSSIGDIVIKSVIQTFDFSVTMTTMNTMSTMTTMTAMTTMTTITTMITIIHREKHLYFNTDSDNKEHKGGTIGQTKSLHGKPLPTASQQNLNI